MAESAGTPLPSVFPLDAQLKFAGPSYPRHMPEPLRARPDVLVLAGGGTLGEAWMRGLLDGAGTAAGIDFRDCEYFVGTSAGSIVASFLAAGRAPDSGAEARAAKDWAEAADTERPRRFAALGRLTAAAAAPLAPIALATVSPGGAVARAAALRAVPKTKRSMPGLARLIDAEGAHFDGRLRIVAVDRRNGRRVVFGAPDAPVATVGQAVLASCAVPGIFAPVEIGDREYVDGGVWSPTNLDATPARGGTEVLCLNPTASLPAGRAPFRALRAFSRSAAAAETLALRARGATVRTIGPDVRAAEAMGLNLMDRGRVPQVLAAGYAQGKALAT
jgi:NTE family protein